MSKQNQEQEGFEEDDDIYADIDQSNDLEELDNEFLDSDEEERLERKSKPKPKEEDDDAEYGKKVQKRISREVSKRKKLEDENLVLNQRLSNLEQKFENKAVNSEMIDIDSRMALVKEKRDKMYEFGDLDPAVEDEWQDLRNEKRGAEYRNQARETERVNATNKQSAIPKAQQEWLDDNDWYFDADNKNSKVAADKYDEMVNKEGYNPNHPGTYKELDKRMNAKGIAEDDSDFEDDTDDNLMQDRDEVPPPPANPNSGGGGRQRKSSKAKLTRSDFDMMNEMGLDPRNAEHRKQLLKNKRVA